MKSYATRKYYTVLLEGRNLRLCVRRRQLDKAVVYLEQALNGMEKLQALLQSDKSGDIASILSSEIPGFDYDMDEELEYRIRMFKRHLSDLMTQLATGEDKIGSEVELYGLQWLGYKKEMTMPLFERVVQDDDNVEIVDEIQYVDNTFRRRQRTTVWNPTPYGRESRSIRYRKMKMTKQLLEAAKTSFRELGLYKQ